MKKCLKDFNRCHTAINRFGFYSSRSKYLNFCSQKKLELYNNNIKKLGSVKCSKEWWKLANSLKNRVYVPALNAEDFLAHFSRVLSDNDQQNDHGVYCMS